MKRHPEYRDGRPSDAGKAVDYERGVIKIGDKEYPMMDTNFPTD